MGILCWFLQYLFQWKILFLLHKYVYLTKNWFQVYFTCQNINITYLFYKEAERLAAEAENAAALAAGIQGQISLISGNGRRYSWTKLHQLK